MMKSWQWRWMERFMRFIIGFALCFLIIFMAGFLIFSYRVMRLPEPDNPRADAIVVLTGGAERIDRALSLLAEERAKRLLISGVHPSTSREALRQRTGQTYHLFACCVDIEHEALNTIGNARETKKWVEKYNFKSLILVTSAYHIPRSTAELKAVMPTVQIIGFPIVANKQAMRYWWFKPHIIRLLLGEYVKYIISILRLSIYAKGYSIESKAGS